MCGIAGIVRFDGQPIAPMRLQAMLDHVSHRGPDGRGVCADGAWAAAHARLSIIDPATGGQPMHAAAAQTKTQTGSTSESGEQGPLSVVFNGEIYNHCDLRTQLEAYGHQFVSNHSDTEVLLLGYRQWGTDLPGHLRGMFAFAIWDAQRHRLLLCRDRFGKKPLYINRDGRRLLFASLVGTIVTAMNRAPSPDPTALLDYLRLGYPFLRSMVDGIEELPPGHWMTVTDTGTVSTQCYWEPAMPDLGSSTARLAALPSALAEAVRIRLEADTPLGCFLSGGIDSSIVAAMAKRQLAAQGGDSLRTFSVAMPQAHYDESHYANMVARHIGAQHTSLHAAPSTAIDDLTHLMTLSGEPTADSSLLPTYWLCRAAREHVTVALSGDGGDELFGGYDRYRALRLIARYGRYLRLLPASGGGEPRSSVARFSRLVRAARAGPEPARQYRRMIYLFSEQQIRELGITASDDPIPPLTNWPAWPDPVPAAMRWDLKHYLPHVLLRKVDRASMAVALEVRCPLLDQSVGDLATALCERELMPRSRPKALLRAMADELLPAAIARRKKQGFAIPIGAWMRQELKQPLADRLFDGTLAQLGLKMDPVRNWFDQHVNGRVNHTHRLFALLQLSLWGQWLHGRPKGITHMSRAP